MTYETISEAIFKYFLKLSYGSKNFIMHFDDYALNSVASECKTNPGTIIQTIVDFYTHKYYFKDAFSDPNNCFGVVSLQLYCASNMGLIFNENQFNPVLAETLNKSIQSLQNIYEYSQDKVWQTAKKHICSLGFISNIPDTTNGPGCYVQYPKSQSYFNHNDLLSFNQFFIGNNRLRPGLEISKSDFFQLLCNNNLYNLRLQVSTRAHRLITAQGINDEILKDQVFRHYLAWEGEILEQTTDNPLKNPNYKLYYDEINGYFLDNEKHRIIIDNKNFKVELLNKNVISANTEFIILKRDPGYGDYVQVSRAATGDLIRVILLTDSPSLFSCLKTWGNEISQIDIWIRIFEVPVRYDLDTTCCLYNKIFLQKFDAPLTWISGIKLNRNTYLHDYGPIFKVNSNTRFDINGEFIDKKVGEILDMSKSPIGTYNVYPIGGRKFSFVISKSHFIDPPPNYENGWDLLKCSPCNSKSHISGFKIFPFSNKYEFTTRNFLDLQNGKKNIKSSQNQLYKALIKQNVKW